MGAYEDEATEITRALSFAKASVTQMEKVKRIHDNNKPPAPIPDPTPIPTPTPDPVPTPAPDPAPTGTALLDLADFTGCTIARLDGSDICPIYRNGVAVPNLWGGTPASFPSMDTDFIPDPTGAGRGTVARLRYHRNGYAQLGLHLGHARFAYGAKVTVRFGLYSVGCDWDIANGKHLQWLSPAGGKPPQVVIKWGGPWEDAQHANLGWQAYNLASTDTDEHWSSPQFLFGPGQWLDYIVTVGVNSAPAVADGTLSIATNGVQWASQTGCRWQDDTSALCDLGVGKQINGNDLIAAPGTDWERIHYVSHYTVTVG